MLLFLLGLWTGSARAMYDPTTYNYQNPTFVNDNFTDAQKASQRSAGAAMMQALVNAANGGQASYTIAPGTYRVNCGTTLVGINNFTINCPNVNIWMEGLNAPPDASGHSDGRGWLSPSYCTNFKILGGNTNFDSENLQFIQATVTAWNANAGTIDIQVMSGYDAAGFGTEQWPGFSWIFSQAGACKLRPNYTAFTNLDPNDITKKRLTVGTGFFTNGGNTALQVGDIFLTRHNCGDWNFVIDCNNSNTNMEIDGINSWYGPMWFGWASQGSFITKNCSNYRRPGTNRIGASSEPDNYAGTKTFVWDGCTSGGPGGDDGIDFTGLYSVLPAVIDSQHVILNFSVSIGASLNFFDPDTAALQGTAKVVAITPINNSAQQAALSAGSNQYQTAHGFRYNNAAPDASYWTVALDQPVGATQFAGWDTDDLAASISVTNSYFADMNAQALFVKARQITLTGNRIDRGTGSAITALLSRYWDEGPMPQNVTISNNIINDNPFNYQDGTLWGWSSAAIEVCVEGSVLGVGPINNVVVSGNKITNSLRAAIQVENAANVKITSNTMTNTMTRSPLDAWLMYDLYGFIPNAGIFVASSRGVTLSGNTLSSPTSFCPNLVQLGPYNALGTISGNGVTGWTTLPINCANTGSTATYASNTDIWTLNSNGYDIEGSADQFLYVDGTASGDHTLEAKMTGIAYTADWAKAGLMFRDTKAANSKMALVCVTAAHGVEFQCRTTAGASPQDAFANWVPTPTASNPVWLRLSKAGNSYIAYYSTDDATWNQVGSAQTVSFTSTNYLAGLAATSLNSSATPGSATFASVRYAETWNVASLLPTNVSGGWDGTLSGAAYDQPSSTWTIQSAGPDISGTSDSGCTYVQGTASGDRTLVTKVTGMTNTSQWAKAGLMLRDTLDPAAAMATVTATPGNGVQFIWRPSSGANTTYVTNGNVPIPTSTNPVWLKLQNTGTACTAYYSLDGVSWAQVGATQTVGFSSSNRLAGLAATGNNGYSVNTATFTNVSLQ